MAAFVGETMSSMSYDELAAENERLRRRHTETYHAERQKLVGELARDALRYRYLRDTAPATIIREVLDHPSYGGGGRAAAEQLDVMIDARTDERLRR